MSTKNKFMFNTRTILASCISALILVYALALTCSMAAMEITAWTITFFVILYVLFDRMSGKPEFKLHTLGVEIPVLGLIIVAYFGLRLNAPDADHVFAIGRLRNLVLLFSMAYALQISKNLNRIMGVIWVAASVIAIYGIWQHFTGIDLWRHDHRALVQVPWGDQSAYSTVGFFSHHLTYGHSFMMILCLPWAVICVDGRLRPWQKAVALLSFALILLSLVFTYGRGVWLAILIALPLMTLFINRKIFLSTIALLLVGGFVLMKSNPLFAERAVSVFAENYNSNDDRRHLWQANLEMFKDHPWIGVGYQQNEALAQTYFKKLNIENGFGGHAHSNYIEILSTTGILGTTAYMLLILSFILMTLRVQTTVPRTHYWHRVFILAALGAQVAFHIGGLTQWNFGDSEVQHQFIFWLAVVSYMSFSYYSRIVPDDHSL
jgi:O-antigen ligase